MSSIFFFFFLPLKVKVEAASVLSGYLLLKTRGKTWNKRWFALRSDFVLYSYRSHQGESRAMTATPVPGFTVSLLSGCTASSSSCSSSLVEGASPSHKPCVAVASPAAEVSTERDRSFKMAHVHKSYLFQAATRQEAERWSMIVQSSVSSRMTVNENAVTGGPSFSRWPPEPIFRLRLDAKDMFIFLFFTKEKNNRRRKRRQPRRKGNQRCCTYLLSHLLKKNHTRVPLNHSLNR